MSITIDYKVGIGALIAAGVMTFGWIWNIANTYNQIQSNSEYDRIQDQQILSLQKEIGIMQEVSIQQLESIARMETSLNIVLYNKGLIERPTISAGTTSINN